MRSLLTIALTVLIWIVSGNIFAEEKTYVPKDYEELYGAWVNLDYTHDPFQKLVIFPDGKFALCSDVNLKAERKENYKIAEKWTDSQGNIWYKVVMSMPRKTGTIDCCQLWKISNSAETAEYMEGGHEYPSKLDPEHDQYRIYSRLSYTMK